MFKTLFLKKLISSLVLAVIIFPSLSVSANQAFRDFIQESSCVPSYNGDPFCPSNVASSATGTLGKLYKAIFSQGAVITLLDEPLSDENLITVVRVCSYKQAPFGTAIVLKSCGEYYMESCPNKVTEPNKFFTSTIQPTIPENVSLDNMGYFTCTTKQVIIAASGTGLIQKYLKMIYNLGTAAAGIFAILVIMFNGIKISVSGSDEGAVDEAKKQILNSLLALTVLFLSGFILYIINPNFFTSI